MTSSAYNSLTDRSSTGTIGIVHMGGEECGTIIGLLISRYRGCLPLSALGKSRHLLKV